MKHIQEIAAQIARETGKVIVGKGHQIRLVTAAMLSGGHILLDDLPGSGKTTLVKAFARVLGCRFSRVQFTPDLLPSDIIGMNVFDQKTGEFVTRHGPVMTNIFLADEINRAIPRTQSALLESMEELQVTIDAHTFPLPQPFLVMATQNPVEMESTFRLPLAQMDRFMLRLSLGYPTAQEERDMLRTVGDAIPFDAIEQVMTAQQITAAQQDIQGVTIGDPVLDYIVRLVEATRQDEALALPVSPRGSRAMYRCAKTWAAMDGRDYVTPDDVKALAPHLLPHRVTLSGEARLAGETEQTVIARLLDTVAVPGGGEDMLHGGR